MRILLYHTICEIIYTVKGKLKTITTILGFDNVTSWSVHLAMCGVQYYMITVLLKCIDESNKVQLDRGNMKRKIPQRLMVGAADDTHVVGTISKFSGL